MVARQRNDGAVLSTHREHLSLRMPVLQPVAKRRDTQVPGRPQHIAADHAVILIGVAETIA